MIVDARNTVERPMRMLEQLAEQGIPCETMHHPPAYTAQRLAKYLHVPGRRVAKSVLLKGPAGFFLAVLPATHHIDLELLASHVGGPLSLANRDEVALAFCDCEWGVAIPFGTRYGLPVYLDESLPADAAIVMEHHSHFEALRMSCKDFEHLEHARRLKFARPHNCR
jgi:Ala-tRNA(Pro) deacylase